MNTVFVLNQTSDVRRSLPDYSALHKTQLHKTFDKPFPKFATNLAISLRSYQSNRKLGNEVVNFTPNFVEKLGSSLREKFAPCSEIVSEFP